MTAEQWREVLRAAEDLPLDARDDLLEKLQWISGGLMLQYDSNRVRKFVALLKLAA